MNDEPIGIFDSGLGGLTVARAVIDKLPHENIIYLGDTAHVPYGPRPVAEVRRLALAGLDALVKQGVKALVIACNTATAAAYIDAHERYMLNMRVPVIEVVSPAAREAVVATRNKRIGIIGTQTTVDSGAYSLALAAVPDLKIFSQACPRFVEFVESGITTGDELTAIAQEYLQPLKNARVDTLILGCTHYPLLTGIISRVMGEDVTLVTSSEATANRTYNKLTDKNLLRTPARSEHLSDAMGEHRFLVTGVGGNFSSAARRYLGLTRLKAELIDVGNESGSQ